ncbi:MAG: flagellar export protein FliJ [Lachnospiraceae bacterium]
MSKFQYQFQNILDIKTKFEEQEKINFQAASVRLKSEQDHLVELVKRKGSYEKEVRALSSGKMNLIKLKDATQAVELMKRKIADQTVVVNHAQRQLDQARYRLQEVMIEKKTFEKLKERRFEAFIQEEQGIENRMTDEQNTFRSRKQ